MPPDSSYGQTEPLFFADSSQVLVRSILKISKKITAQAQDYRRYDAMSHICKYFHEEKDSVWLLNRCTDHGQVFIKLPGPGTSFSMVAPDALDYILLTD